MNKHVCAVVVVGWSTWWATSLAAAAPSLLDSVYSKAVTLAGGSAGDAAAPGGNHYDRDHDWAVVLFDETGASYGPLPQVDEDDRIVVGVVPLDGAVVSDLRITKCVQGSEVRVTGSAQGGTAMRAAQPVEPGAPAAPPPQVADHCGSETGVEATFKDASGKVVTISIPTLPLSRFTVGLGIFFDAAMSSSFATAGVKGQSVPVIVEDRHLGGLSTAAFVTLHFRKVDTLRIRDSFGQVFGIAAGVSFTAPSDHLYLAINLEPLPGFGVLLGYHALRDQTLANGYSVGDALPTGSPPVVKHWVWWGDPRWRAPLFIGVSLDASLLASIMGAISK